MHPDQVDSVNDTDMTALMKSRIEARTNMIEMVASVPVESVDDLEQQNEVFRFTLLRSQEVPINSQVYYTVLDNRL